MLNSQPNMIFEFLIIIYLISILYLVFINVFQKKIERSQHSGFWKIHIWSLPLIAIGTLIFKSAHYGYTHPSSWLWMKMIITHLSLIFFLILVSALEYWKNQKIDSASTKSK